MNLTEIDTAIKKLSALDTYRRFNDDNVRAEYMQMLRDIKLCDFNTAFEQLRISCKELPPMADILSVCRRLQEAPLYPVVPCELCRGTGLVEVAEKRHLRSRNVGESEADYDKQKQAYIFAYRCFCPNGRRWSEKILRIDAVYPGCMAKGR